MSSIDSLDNHLAQAGSFDRAAVPCGLFLAWCANLRLLHPDFEQAHEQALLRLRVRDTRGSEVFASSCGGELTEDILTERGREFVAAYYPSYLQIWFPSASDDPYDVDHEWATYEAVAPRLNEALLGPKSSGRRWWQFWKKR